MKKIPLFKVYMPKEAGKAVLDVLYSGFLAEGDKVMEFRESLRRFFGTQYVVPVNSCTSALHIAYVLSGVGPGDEVISSPLTCVATNTPLLNLGAKIIWADCEPDTGMIDPKSIEKLITKKTKAIVVLHKDGDLAKMDEILDIGKRYNIKIIEDAAHALGAKYKGKLVGTIGDYTCFSFQAIKHITTGDGGALVCKSKADFDRAKKLKWLGIDKEALVGISNPWEVDITDVGYKSNMNNISAAIGVESFKYVSKVVQSYHENGELYTKMLGGVKGVSLINRRKADYSAHWTYVIMVEDREKIMKALRSFGIDSRPVHLRNDVYSIFRQSKRSLPGVDHFSAKELSLPCGWWVKKKDIIKIVKIIKNSL